MKKLVVFDWGGVIEKFGKGKYTVRDANLLLLKHMGYNFDDKPEEEVIRELVKDVKNTFTISTNEEMKKWYSSICNKFESNLSYEDFAYLYKKYYEKSETNTDTINLIYETSKSNDIALLSNLNILDLDRLQKQIDLDRFNYLFLSCKLNMKKPDEEIYEHVEEITNTKPENILFVDDSIININAADKRGWNTVNENGMNTKNIKKKILEFTK